MSKTTQTLYHTHISSKHSWFDLNLKEVWRYRDLITLFTRRSFVLTYKQTILGPAWIFLTPLFSSIVHAFVFGGIAGIATDGIPTLLFYLCSNAIWTFFASCLTNNANTFTANAYMFGKVYFPRLTMPISNVISSVIRFCIQMLLVLAFMVWFLVRGEVAPNWGMWLMVPVELIHLGMLGMGFGIIISSLTTKYRDLTILVDFGVSLWMYVTPIVYPISTLGEGWIRKILMVNPVTMPVEMMRMAILGKGSVEMGFYGLSWAITLIVALLGVIVFNKVEKNFMDTV